ncbi:NAD-dependent deacylase [Prosthecobacter sp.]|uniref:NAD-dependent deacylase n=1 Tax=Prosthecobacter sp. TaxID=1965333 RepID=UPI003784F6F7
MSAESGVPTFRGEDGLWEGHHIEMVASPEGFARDPELVHRFYNLRRAALNTVEPNAGHLALAQLEREWHGRFLLVTQNVDDLHERAGSEKLIHMHGELRKARCECCGAVFSWSKDLASGTRCRACGEVGGMRPHIVWFGEFPFELEAIMNALKSADIFLCIGTSGVVYPAAGFARQAAERASCHLIEMNIERTEISRHFHEHIVGPVSVELPKLVQRLLSA